MSCCDFTSTDVQQLIQYSVYINVIKFHGRFYLEKEFSLYQNADTSNNNVIETVFHVFSRQLLTILRLELNKKKCSRCNLVAATLDAKC